MNRLPCFHRSPNASNLTRKLFRTTCLLILAGTVAYAEPAESAAPGTITGRVINSVDGRSLNNAVITIQGTNIEVATNEYGEFTIPQVPSGTVMIKASFTGQDPQVAELTVKPGATVTKDFSLLRKTTGEATVTLETFKVESERFRNAQEIAANEEIQSVTIKNVVATDSLGYVADGNIGDFVKYLPGVDIGTGGTYVNGSDTSSISVRGFGAENTAVTIDGMPVSSPSPASLTRAVGLDMISINNASMIEVIKVPSPDSDSNSPGGSINLVTRNAFEYSKPRYSFDVTASLNSLESPSLSKRPGPTNKKSYHTLPGARVSLTYPFGKTLGISLSLSSDNKYSPNYSASSSYNFAGLTWSGTPVANANGVSSLSNPQLKQYSVVDNPWDTFRSAGSFKVDWKPTNNLIINAKVDYSQYTGNNVSRRLQFTSGTPTDWTSDYVLGRLYATGTTSDPGNKTAMTIDARDKAGTTKAGSLKLDYKLGYWKFNAAASRSISDGRFDDMNHGHFSGIDMKITPGQVNFYDIENGIPDRVTVADRNGNAVDYTKLSNWAVDGTLVAKSGEAFQQDIMDRVTADLSRDFVFRFASFTLKTGYAYNAKDQRKWGRGTGYQMRYIGPTMPSADMLDEGYQQAPGFGLAPQQWFDVYRLYEVFNQNPALFNPDYDASMMINNYVSQTNQTKSVKEQSNAYFVQLDARFFHNRLGIRTGARKSTTTIDGYQPITDSKFNFVKLPDGTLYTDSVYINGVRIDGGTSTLSTIDPATGKALSSAKDAILTDPALIARMKAAGAIVPDHVMWANNGALVGVAGTNATNLELAKLRLAPRTLHRKRTRPETPMLALTYRLLPNLSLKTSWSRETALPNLESTTTGGILAANGSLTINENATPTGEVGGDGTISGSNVGLNPQTTDSYNIGFNFRTKTGGSLNASYFYKKTSNLWEEVTIDRSSPEYNEVLDGLGLDPLVYSNWTVKTTINGVASSNRWGFELDGRQNLGALGSFGRRFNIWFAYSHSSPTATTFTADVLGQFQIKSRDIASAGVSFNAGRFSVQLADRWKQQGYTKNSTVYTYNGLKYAVYNDNPIDNKLNLQVNIDLTKHYNLFLSVANILNQQPKRRVYDPVTKIIPVYATSTSAQDNGMAINVGVSGRW